MKLTGIRKTEAWERYFAVARKNAACFLRKTCKSRPIFILGKQRSGTTMLMYTFHRHPEVLVYDEHRSSEAFNDYQLRDSESIRRLIEDARFPVVCFKPICNSHKINIPYREFPDCGIVWAYREFRDVANSTQRMFQESTRAIRLVCTNRPGSSWFREGVSPTALKVLQDVYRPDLSDFRPRLPGLVGS